MKPIDWIIPAAIVVGVVTWNVQQTTKLGKVERENRELKARLEESVSSSGARISSSRQRKNIAPTDWKEIAEKLNATEEEEGGLEEIMSIHDRVSLMSDSELVDALDQIASMDLDEEDRKSIEELLIDPLIEKNPQLAIEKFADRIKTDEEGVGWQLSQALANWAKGDISGAAKWLDEQIASGTFEAKSLDGRNDLLLDYEAALMGELLSQNPPEAQRRLATLPEEQRREALERITFTDLGASAQGSYADLVRSLIPADERSGSFVNIMDQIVPENGLVGVDAFFDQVHASEEEKNVAARQAANANIIEISSERAVTAADVDAMRSWLQRYSPGQVNEVTGQALAEAVQDEGEFTFSQASALAKQYHQQSGDDQVIIGFLESYSARSHLEEALPLAELIKDPVRRQEILAQLQ